VFVRAAGLVTHASSANPEARLLGAAVASSMASSTNSGSAADAGDELDQLLDSALDDFTSLDLSASAATKRSASVPPFGAQSFLWSSERITDCYVPLALCSSGGEASGSASGAQGPVKGLGMGLPDPKAPRRRAAKQPTPPPRGAYASEALEKLTREARDAVRGLETATGGIPELDDDAMMDELFKQFEEIAGAQVTLLEPPDQRKF
jgi:peroxin-19